MHTAEYPAEIRHAPFLLRKVREGSYIVLRVTDGHERRIGSVYQQPVNSDSHPLRWVLWLTGKKPSCYLASIEAVMEELDEEGVS